MKSFYERDDYDTTSIQQLIDNEVEESIYLEFKESRALSKVDEKKKFDISKDVASFANSDGGTIIYGIKEMDHKACEFSFIDGNVITKEWLQQVIESNIQRNIPDLKIFPIRFDGDISKTVYVVKIPASLEAPHISKDNKYYRRFNFQSHPMEEYEIRNLYNRKGTAKLEIDNIYISNPTSVEFKEGFKKFKIWVDVVNTGNVVETIYKINLYSKLNPNLDYSWDRPNNYVYTILDHERVKISAVGIHPIFPNEVITVLRVNCELKEEYFPFENDLEVRLYYQNGEDKSDFTCKIGEDY